MRLGELYREFSKHYDINLLTSTDFGARFEQVTHRPGFTEIRFPKDDHWRRAYDTLEESGMSGELAGLAFLLAVSDPSCQLRQVAQELAKEATIIIHEFPYSEPIFSDSRSPPEIYNSHNVEVNLFSSTISGPGSESGFLRLLRAEGNLVRRAGKVFATSESDAETFRLLYGVNKTKINLCPNGFSRAELDPVAGARLSAKVRSPSRPTLLFSGSGHYPNVEAAEFILRLAAEIPECDFVLAGGVCRSISGRKLPENVRSYGPFTPSQKIELLERADIFLNPVTLGSGTSLKALESMGAGLPTVATPEGVRGLGLVADVHAKIVPRHEIAGAIRSLLNDPQTRTDIAKRAREYALSQFTWEKVARNFTRAVTAKEISDLPDRPLVLALNDFPVLEARSGGEVRIRKLLGNLQCDVVLLTFGSQYQAAYLDDGLLHFSVPKSQEHIALERAINDKQSVSAYDAVAALFAGTNQTLCETVAMFARRASAVIYEHPYMAGTLDTALSVRPDLPVVYSSHNVEATHKAELLTLHPLRRQLISFVMALESRLIDVAALVVCCSAADATYFAAKRKRFIVVPNGCDIPERRFVGHGGRTSELRVGFLGSSHPPNAVAARFIIDSLAPSFPEVQFEFVGLVCDAISDVFADNILRHGILSGPEKTDVMRGWDLALNPIESGGGSSLKLPDYMAHGVPALNTAVGARSFDVEARGAGRIASLADFPTHLRQLLEDRERLAAMGDNAYRYAQEALEWSAITTQYRAELATLLAAPGDRPHRRLLVVTYRYTEPTLGGAEEYLVEILKRLRSRFDTIDLAAVDVRRITNRHHFGCETTPGPGAAGRVGALFDHSYYFASESPPEAELIGRCRDLERMWSHEDFDLYREFIDDLAQSDELRLLGGFFGLEIHDGFKRRWTAPRFSFLLPVGATMFRITGWGATEKHLNVRLIDIARDGTMREICGLERRIGAAVDLSLSLPPARSGVHRVLEIEVDEHTAPGDHRPFGILLQSANAWVARGLGETESLSPLDLSPADFAGEVSQILRVRRTLDWVGALRAAALRRDPSADEHFAAARGPHAPAMQDWLAEHASNYDVVLVQGIPFDVIPRTVQSLARLPNRPRIVTLPHFHGDDRFYHWGAYYEAFEAADCTLLFSEFLAERLGAREKIAVVPGGGVRMEEISDVGARENFKAVHKSDKPFFLVLGRKVGSKGYERAIAAHRRLRGTHPDVELVLIGPDDDGRQVSGEGVNYLGRQDRSVVRGALASCLALVTLSESESFGIVLCEAWLFGKPVIANAKCYSFRELVRDGETGLLVDSDDEIVRAMRELVEDPQRRVRMGQAGFRVVAERYSWVGVAEVVYSALVLNSDSPKCNHELEDGNT